LDGESATFKHGYIPGKHEITLVLP